MAEHIYFLCHSGADKEVVRQVADKLGRGECWIDEGEIKGGEVILDKIDRGISDSRIFVLFWSRHSAQSDWVAEEVSQARIRSLRDRGFRLVVVRIDQTELPDYLSKRLYLNIERGLDKVVQSLIETAKDLTPPSILMGSAELKDSFQGREREMNKLEEVSFSGEYGGLLVLGLPGMGKTTFVKRAIAKVFSGLTPIWVDLSVCPTPLRFLSALVKPLSIGLDPSKVGFDFKDLWSKTIFPEIAHSERLFVVLDNCFTPEDLVQSQNMEDLAKTVVQDLVKVSKCENPGVIIINSFEPKLEASVLARLTKINIKKLETRDMVRALRYHLHNTLGGMIYPTEDLEKLAFVLKGYPLSIGLAAAQISEHGLDLVLSDLQGLHALLFRLAQELMAGISLSDDEKSVLISLSTAERPLTSDMAKELLGKKFILLKGLASKQLLELSGEVFAIHDILRNYVLQSMALPEHITRAHEKLSDLFNAYWKRSPEMSAQAVEMASMAYFHSISAGKYTDAEMIKTAYKEEAKNACVELYRRGDYKIALSYIEQLSKIEESPEPMMKYYYSLCLNRTGNSVKALKVINELIKQEGSVSKYYHSKGIILRHLNRNQEALDAFRLAVSASHRKDTFALSSLAEQLRLIGNPKEALKFAEEAFKIDPRESYPISVLVDIYRDLGDMKKGLSILEESIKKRQTDTRLHARAGIIAKDMGDLIRAREHLSKASSDPSLTHTITALADVYIGLNEYELADHVLEKYPVRAYKNGSYWSTKANILRHKKDFHQALQCIEEALKLENTNPFHYGGAAQIYLDIAKDALQDRNIEECHLQLNMAKENLNRGLRLSPSDQILLSIQEHVRRLEESIL